jgi:hypothetical protein
MIRDWSRETEKWGDTFLLKAISAIMKRLSLYNKNLLLHI